MGELYTSGTSSENSALKQHILDARDNAGRRMAIECACSLPRPRIIVIDPDYAPVQPYAPLSSVLREEAEAGLAALSWLLPEVKRDIH